jgi:hypothetical protein
MTYVTVALHTVMGTESALHTLKRGVSGCLSSTFYYIKTTSRCTIEVIVRSALLPDLNNVGLKRRKKYLPEIQSICILRWREDWLGWQQLPSKIHACFRPAWPSCSSNGTTTASPQAFPKALLQQQDGSHSNCHIQLSCPPPITIDFKLEIL